ncbi:uncharacterized protein BP01DRAFT_402493 [Aspergillus saccharolyticus JOP 1030-1]|uniref:Zn(2)-C6 fungal-type domain-containing protein n=1 Tax=Aspergillus saccharolyticus JOP 1030-1 TaxID=1450539 RepID=A0A318ZUH6_9EURO|nr:hypothetical protein BP01DRAFT_402493 [Aspergillus saccharolyticus JOP 1030-1]PYH43728.1 hypothetical protein BP01DRAFT_402493 [Aspergillus saccharolyticus JOP 1030-1]
MPNPRPSKRKRIGRACDQCRRRKSKCGGEQPECSICQAANRSCTYQNSSRRRGLQSGYVRSLEVALGFILDRVPSSGSTLQRIVHGAQEGKRFASNEWADRWRKSRLAKEVIHLAQVDSGHDADDADLDDMGEMDLLESWLEDEGEGVGGGGEEQQMEMEGEVAGDERGEQSPPPPQQQQAPPDPPSYHVTSDAQIADSLDWPYPDSTADLVNHYFLHTHSWFPIIERREILRIMHTHSNSPKDSACRLLLWAILAYTSTTCDVRLNPTPRIVQQSIQKRIVRSYENTDLHHIQALLLLVLIHLEWGDLNQAWVLVGQATRLLVMLPESARTHRHKHAFVGCTLLDGIISALLDETPSLLAAKHLVYTQVEEDDVDEWDTWTSQRIQGAGLRSRSTSPLRALSTFNTISKLIQSLNRVSLCTSGFGSLHALLAELQRLQKQIAEHRPYRGVEYATPPLLTLHLTSGFIMLKMIDKGKLMGTFEAGENVQCLRTMVNLLDDYVEITGNARSTPLLRCFTFQVRQSMQGLPQCSESEDAEHLMKRVSHHADMLKLDNIQLHPDPETPLFRQHGLRKLDSTFLGSTPSWPITGSGIGSDYMAVVPVIPHIPTAARVVPETLAAQPLQPPDADDFGDLFEEIMTSIPISRHEPTFAENLGFYAGNMDTDFLEQLQHIHPNT